MNRRNVIHRLGRSAMAGRTRGAAAISTVGRRLSASAIAAAAWLTASAAAACPNCKEAIARGDGSGGDLASGFYYSILFMMSMPFLLTGLVSLGMYRAVRNGRPPEGDFAPAEADFSPPGPDWPARAG